MVDRRKIVEQWRRGAGRVLVTLVRAEGSSYRKPGAHLLIGANAEYAGSISGGCLEAEVVRKAAWMVRNGAIVQRYSTLFDDTAEMPFGLGCGGVVDLLIEPVETPECQAFLAAMERSLADRESTVLTSLPREGMSLSRTIFDSDDRELFSSPGFPAFDRTTGRLQGDPAAAPLDDERAYVETLSAPHRLFVLGAGDDAKPLVTMAALLGWNVVVADARSQLARHERFPEATRVLTTSSLEDLPLSDGDAVVLMTHSYEQDRKLLHDLLQPGFAASGGERRFIGLLGARHRSGLLLREVAHMLGRSLEECCEKVCAPVGLDLGGDGPEAIALATVAQVQGWLQGKIATPQTLASADMRPGDSSHYLQTRCAIGAAE